MDEIKAERDEIRPAGRMTKARPEPRLAYEIALGIWLGGVALIVTGSVLGLMVAGVISGALRVHFG